MLSKLLKYDFKYIYKMLVVLYILTLIFGGITRILWQFDSTIFGIMGGITGFITVVGIFGIIINNLIRCWLRFTNNIYKDESYLTHTLPVKKSSIYASKIISSLITLATSIVVIIASLFIAFYSKGNFDIVKMILDELAYTTGSSAIWLICIVFIILTLEFLAVLMAGYTGLIIGHRYGDNKMMKSIFWGFIILIGSATIMLLIIFIFGIFTKDIMDIFLTNTMPNIETLKSLLYGVIFLYMIENTIYYLVDLHLLQKGVNVD